MAAADRTQGSWLLRIDRRFVYLFVMLALAAPLIVQRFTTKLTMKPAPLPSARRIFDRIEQIARERNEFERNPDGSPKLDKNGKPKKYNKVVLVVPDFGPQTKAELEPMIEAVVRHLMIRRLKFVLMTNVIDGAGYCKNIPERLGREYGLTYGKDWANFGWKPGRTFFIKQMAREMKALGGDAERKADLAKDSDADIAQKLPCMAGIKSASDVALVVEVTGLVGFVEMWIGYFANEKDRPEIAHGCTSVSIPDAFASMEAGKLVGLFEGIAGAAAYNEFLKEIRQIGQPQPSSVARGAMTSQTVAHLMVIVFVLLGNVGLLVNLLRRKRGG